VEGTGPSLFLHFALRIVSPSRSAGSTFLGLYQLLEEEGLCVGLSTGINIAGAIRMARDMGPGHTIVTILCDYGTRYQSKLFNPEFMRSKGLPVPAWLERKATVKAPLV